MRRLSKGSAARCVLSHFYVEGWWHLPKHLYCTPREQIRRTADIAPWRSLAGSGLDRIRDDQRGDPCRHGTVPRYSINISTRGTLSQDHATQAPTRVSSVCTWARYARGSRLSPSRKARMVFARVCLTLACDSATSLAVCYSCLGDAYT